MSGDRGDVVSLADGIRRIDRQPGHAGPLAPVVPPLVVAADRPRPFPKYSEQSAGVAT